MPDFAALISDLINEASHHPFSVYIFVISFLFASSFGLPFPEEVVLLSSGAIAAAAIAEGRTSGLAPTINAYTLAGVCFAAVLLSDFLVYTLGRMFGLSLLKRKPLARLITPSILERVSKWTQRYGSFACGVFRFTPGLRFPGHFMCGALGVSRARFLMVDGFAALISVPTQVLFLAFYGDEVLGHIKQFKMLILIGLALFGIFWFTRSLMKKKRPAQILLGYCDSTKNKDDQAA